MKLWRYGSQRARTIPACVLLVMGALSAPLWAHVTLRPNQPLRPKGFATVSLVVPNERHVDTTKVTLEVPQAFLKAGGRLSRVEYPSGWQVTLEKEDKPGEIYQHEMDDRSKRQSDAERGGKPGKTEAEKQEQKILDELRKKWIKKVAFEGGSISPDGFKVFQLSFELPDQEGEFRFPAVQSYSDGKDVSWSELVQGAEHPAASIVVEKQNDLARMATPFLAGVVLVLLLLFVKRLFGRKKEGARDLTPVS